MTDKLLKVSSILYINNVPIEQAKYIGNIIEELINENKKFDKIKDILREEEILDKDNNLNDYLMKIYTLDNVREIFELLK